MEGLISELNYIPASRDPSQDALISFIQKEKETICNFLERKVNECFPGRPTIVTNRYESPGPSLDDEDGLPVLDEE